RARTEAERAKQEEEQQKQVAIRAQKNEEQHRKVAEVARVREADARAKAEQLLVRQHVANGVRRMDSDDLLGALPWLATALKWEHNNPVRDEVHRTRFASLLRLCPKLERVWVHPGRVAVAEFSPDGRRALTGGATADGKGQVRLWDTTSGKPFGPELPHNHPVVHAAF